MITRKILHPEILLGRTTSELDDGFAWLRKGTEFVPPTERSIGKLVPKPGPYFDHAQWAMRDLYTDKVPQDINLYEFMYLAWKFVDSKASTYYLPKSFCRALSKIDRELRPEYLPKDFTAHLSFPSNTFVTHDGADIHGLYIRVTDRHEIAPKGPFSRWVMMSYIYTPAGETDLNEGAVTSVSFPLLEGLTVANSMNEHFVRNGKPVGEAARIPATNLIATVAINAVLFINWEDQEIINLRPTRAKTTAEKKATIKTNGGHANNCTIPIKLLNFSFHGIQYTVDETSVRGHFRWQPYGPGKQKVKPIWIDEHLRTFKKAEAAEELEKV